MNINHIRCDWNVFDHGDRWDKHKFKICTVKYC